MKAKKCDRCGRFYTNVEAEYRKSLVENLGFYLYGDYVGDTMTDLCEDCMTELLAWLSGKEFENGNK